MGDIRYIMTGVRRYFTSSLRDEMKQRLYDIARIENITLKIALEKAIQAYVPIPSQEIPTEYRLTTLQNLKRLYKNNPHAIVITPNYNTVIGIDHKTWKSYKDGIITLDKFKRIYLERLLMPDAQEEIKKIKELSKTNIIYITSWEKDEECSLRKLFKDYLEGKLIWK